jgi:P27 family predicted phage terminase small subunit
MGRPKQSKTPPTFGQPAKPVHLSPEASRQWDRLVSEIEASGLLITPAHRGLIQLAATLMADLKSDWAELEKEGQYHVSPKGGIMAHPALKRMDALRRDLIKTLSAIGLRPGLPSERDEGDRLEDLLNA